jgi:hypothetical protein
MLLVSVSSVEYQFPVSVSVYVVSVRGFRLIRLWVELVGLWVRLAYGFAPSSYTSCCAFAVPLTIHWLIIYSVFLFARKAVFFVSQVQ